MASQSALRRVQSTREAEPVAANGPAFADPVRPTTFPPTDRRQADRRGMDKLRSEALSAIVTMVEDRNFGGLRDRVPHVPLRGDIPRSRLVLIAVAILAGGAAAWLATRHDEPAPVAAAAVPQIVAPAMTQVLVAKAAITTGQRLTADSIGWADWPVANVLPQYVDIAATPAAATDMAGAVARTDFVPGEPIRPDRLATSGDGSLSALLDDGMRGVSVTVSAEAASGGFVVPGDRVDVVLTRPDPHGGQQSQTILSDVKVVAINSDLGHGEAKSADATTSFSATAIATLALDPRSAEIIINSASSGKLSLVLVPVTATEPGASASERAANAAIRLTSPFWTN
jgi:pilus assembly protein CpaB